MSAITSNYSQSNSFIYNDQYFGHSFMEPALRCWEKMTEPFPSDFNNRLVSCISRAFAFLGLLLSSILFVPGLICKSIDYLINGPLSYPDFTQNSPVSLILLARGDPNLEAEVQKLHSLQLFGNEPTQINYLSLPIASRYLVAGRYTYPVTFGWNLLTRFQLMEIFEQDFQSGVNVPRFIQAIREAIDLQEKILFAKILSKSLERRENFEALANIKPQIFNEIRECLRKGHGFPQDRGLDSVDNILRANPDNPRTLDIIRRAAHLWDSAYYDINFFDFR